MDRPGPGRVIFLVDMNAFFITCEMVRNLALRDGPAAVAGDPRRRTGIILAANYEARACGVRTAMVLHEALRLCPGLKRVPPDHDYYALQSREVMAILGEFTPLLEQNSIDEAWLDMTGCASLFGPPLAAARQVMDTVEQRLGLWCSIGIAANKFLAKMASDLKKPRGISELWAEDVPLRLWPLPVQAMVGIGARTAERLNRLGVRTIGDLARLDPDFVSQTFGQGGRELLQHANGIDPSAVQPHLVDDLKSIGRSTTLPTDVTDLAQARLVLISLADDVARTARRHDKKGTTVQISLKYADFQGITRQVTVPRTAATRVLCEAACRLLTLHWDSRRPVRLIGVSLTGFGDDEPSRQLSLFDEIAGPGTQAHLLGCANPAPGAADPASRQARLDQTIDRIRAKLGTDSITVAALVKRPKADA